MYKTVPHNDTIAGTTIAAVMIVLEVLFFIVLLLPLTVILLPFALVQKAVKA